VSKKNQVIEKTVKLKNKKASFDFEYIEVFVAGVVLRGTEIKSIRTSKASFQDSYCLFENGELWLKKFHISAYEHGTYLNHDPLRDRKFLIRKKELRRLEKKAEEKGLAIVPTFLFINDRGKCKIEVALAKGKKQFDKRDDIKTRDVEREMKRAE
jgi:SsrA-binding protein